MRKLIISLLLILPAAFPGRAADDFYMQQAEIFSQGALYQGSLDMLSQYLPTARDNERARLLQVEAAVRSASPEAISLTRQFIDDFPLSPALPAVTMLHGDCLLDAGRPAEALTIYGSIHLSEVNSWQESELALHTAMAAMATAQPDVAEAALQLVTREPYYSQATIYRACIAYSNGNYQGTIDILGNLSPGSPTHATLATALKARAHYALADYQHALQEATEVLAADNSLAYNDMNRIAGEALVRLKRSDEALPYLETYVSQADEVPSQAWYYLGLARYENKQYQATCEALKHVTTGDQTMAQNALLVMGQALMAQGDYTAAIAPLRLAAATDADPALTEEALYNHAVATIEGGKMPFSNSIPMLEKFLKRYPKSRYAPEVAEYVAMGYINQDDYEGALRNLDAIPHPSADISRARQHVLYMLSVRDLQNGKYSQALDYLNKALAVKEGTPAMKAECLLLKGDALYRLKRYADSRQCYNTYLGLSDATAANKPLARYDRAYTLYALEQWKDAATGFEQAYNSQSLSTDVRADAASRAADSYYYLKNLTKAIDAYKRAALTEPSKADYPEYRRGVMLGLRGDNAQALEVLDGMIATFPSSPLVPEAMLDKADVLISLDRVAPAADTYRRVADNYPRTTHASRALLLLGALQAARLDASAAIDTYRELVLNYSPSADATAGANALKELAEQEGRLDEFLQLVNDNPSLVNLEPSELDRLAFNNATTARRLEDYLNRYPAGQHRPEAMLRLANMTATAGNHEEVIKWTDRLTADYPQSPLAGEALLLRADARYATGLIPEAREDYRLAATRTSGAPLLNRARLGILATARDLGDDNEVIEVADMLTASSSLGAGQMDEVLFAKAVALSHTDRPDEAAALWQQLSADPNTLTGAKSTYYLAQYQYDSGRYRDARTTVTRLTSSSTPHSYWLARGYILMSDLYHADGKDYEALEYLKSIRDNYPGTEPDIFSLIDQRIQELQ